MLSGWVLGNFVSTCKAISQCAFNSRINIEKIVESRWTVSIIITKIHFSFASERISGLKRDERLIVKYLDVAGDRNSPGLESSGDDFSHDAAVIFQVTVLPDLSNSYQGSHAGAL